MLARRFRRALFCTQPPKPDIPEPLEFEAPRDDTIDHKASRKLAKRYFFIFPVVAYIIYDSLFKRKCEFSDRVELKLVSHRFEKFLGRLSEKKIEKELENKLYKDDTEEVK